MMHPQLDEIIHHIRKQGMIAGLISNGYYFTPERIKRLNKAGLQHLQISIDNVDPDEVSRKSLRVPELCRYPARAEPVLSILLRNPQETLPGCFPLPYSP